jgi:hypothetical protein
MVIVGSNAGFQPLRPQSIAELERRVSEVRHIWVVFLAILSGYSRSTISGMEIFAAKLPSGCA